VEDSSGARCSVEPLPGFPPSSRATAAWAWRRSREASAPVPPLTGGAGREGCGLGAGGGGRPGRAPASARGRGAARGRDDHASGPRPGPDRARGPDATRQPDLDPHRSYVRCFKQQARISFACSASCSVQPWLGRAGDTIMKTTVDHACMGRFLVQRLIASLRLM
jgi:hypothetical protein